MVVQKGTVNENDDAAQTANTDMALKKFHIYLKPGQITRLKRLSRATRLAQAVIIRDAIDAECARLEAIHKPAGKS